MILRTRLNSKLLLAIVLAGIASLPFAAHAADVSVNFSMQVSAKNLDPRVEAIKLNCVVYDAAMQQSLSQTAPDANPIAAVAGSFNGTLNTKVIVPAAKVKDAKQWSCTVDLRGPNNQFFTGTQEWGHLEGGDYKSTLSGKF